MGPSYNIQNLIRPMKWSEGMDGKWSEDGHRTPLGAFVHEENGQHVNMQRFVNRTHTHTHTPTHTHIHTHVHTQCKLTQHQHSAGHGTRRNSSSGDGLGAFLRRRNGDSTLFIRALSADANPGYQCSCSLPARNGTRECPTSLGAHVESIQTFDDGVYGECLPGVLPW